MQLGAGENCYTWAQIICEHTAGRTDCLPKVRSPIWRFACGSTRTMHKESGLVRKSLRAPRLSCTRLVVRPLAAAVTHGIGHRHCCYATATRRTYSGVRIGRPPQRVNEAACGYSARLTCRPGARMPAPGELTATPPRGSGTMHRNLGRCAACHKICARRSGSHRGANTLSPLSRRTCSWMLVGALRTQEKRTSRPPQLPYCPNGSMRPHPPQTFSRVRLSWRFTPSHST